MIYNNYMHDLEIFIYKIRGVWNFIDNKIKIPKTILIMIIETSYLVGDMSKTLPKT